MQSSHSLLKVSLPFQFAQINCTKYQYFKLGIVAHTLALSTQRQVGLCESKASLVYIKSSQAARNTQRPGLK